MIVVLVKGRHPRSYNAFFERGDAGCKFRTSWTEPSRAPMMAEFELTFAWPEVSAGRGKRIRLIENGILEVWDSETISLERISSFFDSERDSGLPTAAAPVKLIVLIHDSESAFVNQLQRQVLIELPDVVPVVVPSRTGTAPPRTTWIELVTEYALLRNIAESMVEYSHYRLRLTLAARRVRIWPLRFGVAWLEHGLSRTGRALFHKLPLSCEEQLSGLWRLLWESTRAMLRIPLFMFFTGSFAIGTDVLVTRFLSHLERIRMDLDASLGHSRVLMNAEASYGGRLRRLFLDELRTRRRQYFATAGVVVALVTLTGLHNVFGCQAGGDRLSQCYDESSRVVLTLPPDEDALRIELRGMERERVVDEQDQ